MNPKIGDLVHVRRESSIPMEPIYEGWAILEATRNNGSKLFGSWASSPEKAHELFKLPVKDRGPYYGWNSIEILVAINNEVVLKFQIQCAECYTYVVNDYLCHECRERGEEPNGLA